MSEFIEEKQTPFEGQLGDGVRLPENFHESMPSIDRFRVYEAQPFIPPDGLRPPVNSDVSPSEYTALCRPLPWPIY